MKEITVFFRKEFTEYKRTGKLAIILIVFAIFGILNPAIAKLTPLLFKSLGSQMAEQGITIAEVDVTALNAWEQFYKNMPIILIVFVIMFSGIVVNEINRGTLINILSKGLKRWKVILAKTASLLALWTVSYSIMYGITYGYSAFYWDNGIAKHIVLSAVLVYLVGVWIISLIMLSSTLVSQNYAVMLTTGGVCIISYLIGLIPDAAKYMPTTLLKAGSIVNSKMTVSEFTVAVVITAVLIIGNIIIAAMTFNKKRV